MGVLVWFIVVLGALPLAYFSWVSLQSILQARRMLQVVPMEEAGEHLRERIAVHSRIRVVQPGIIYPNVEVLWYKIVTEELTESLEGRGWKKISTQEYTAEFLLVEGETEVSFGGPASEMQGVHSDKVYHDRSGCSGFGLHGVGTTRRRRRWLPMSSSVTVVGRLEEDRGRGVLVKDEKLGLLLSSCEPWKAAALEIVKGSLGLFLVTLVIIGWLVVYFLATGD